MEINSDNEHNPNRFIYLTSLQSIELSSKNLATNDLSPKNLIKINNEVLEKKLNKAIQTEKDIEKLSKLYIMLIFFQVNINRNISKAILANIKFKENKSSSFLLNISNSLCKYGVCNANELIDYEIVKNPILLKKALNVLLKINSIKHSLKKLGEAKSDLYNLNQMKFKNMLKSVKKYGKNKNKVEELFNQLLKKEQLKVPILFFYRFAFYQWIYSNQNCAIESLKKITKLDLSLSFFRQLGIRNKTKNLTYSILISEFHKEKLNIKSYFGDNEVLESYNKKELIGNSINKLIPLEMRDCHDTLLKSENLTGNIDSEFWKGDIPLISANQNIMCSKLKLKLLLSKNNNLNYFSLIETKEQNCLILLTTANLSIINLCQKALDSFEKNLNFKEINHEIFFELSNISNRAFTINELKVNFSTIIQNTELIRKWGIYLNYKRGKFMNLKTKKGVKTFLVRTQEIFFNITNNKFFLLKLYNAEGRSSENIIADLPSVLTIQEDVLYKCYKATLGKNISDYGESIIDENSNLELNEQEELKKSFNIEKLYPPLNYKFLSLASKNKYKSPEKSDLLDQNIYNESSFDFRIDFFKKKTKRKLKELVSKIENWLAKQKKKSKLILAKKEVNLLNGYDFQKKLSLLIKKKSIRKA